MKLPCFHPSGLSPVTQTSFGSPCGNCLEACVATLLGIPLETVPDPRRGLTCAEAERALPLRSPALGTFLAQFGLAAVSGEGSHGPVPPGAPPVFWIGSGPGPRGFDHAVVYVSGGRAPHPVLFWDPHPDRTGLLALARWTAILPLA